MSALDDRRQAAREAAHDGLDLPDLATRQAIDDAIETATRVRITPEIIDRFMSHDEGGGCDMDVREALTDAFTSAGFEVES